MIVGFVLTALFAVTIPETRHGVLLARKAKTLREATGNQNLYAEHETIMQRNFRYIGSPGRRTVAQAIFADKSFAKLWRVRCVSDAKRPVPINVNYTRTDMLFFEPIVLLFALFDGVNYSCM